MNTSRRPRLLVVEDDPDCRDLVALLLSDDFDVIAAASAEAAMALVPICRPHLVLTDQTLAGISGTELARRLKAAWPQIAVVLMSGHWTLPDTAACDAVLCKPFSADGLLAVTRRFAGAGGFAPGAEVAW